MCNEPVTAPGYAIQNDTRIHVSIHVSMRASMHLYRHACASVYTEFCGTFLVVHVYIDMTEHSTSDMPIRVHKHQCVNRVCKLKKNPSVRVLVYTFTQT